MSNIGIYKITSPTNKVYIGQSWNLLDREGDYRRTDCKKQPKLYNSINKYGWELHKFEVVMFVSENVTQLMFDQIEQAYIDFYRNNGYELLNTREAGATGRHSEETKKKMSAAKKGKVFTDVHRENLSKAHKGKFKGEKNPNYGKPLHENCRKRRAEVMKDYVPSADTREKISKAHKELWSDPEYRDMMSENRKGEKNPFYGKKLSPEHIEKLRRINLGHEPWNKGKTTSEETKRKIGDANRRANKKSKIVHQYDLDGNFIKEWPYVEMIKNELKVHASHIHECCNGKRKSAGGFKWKYKEEKLDNE